MSNFTLSSISLAPIPGVHGGTGLQQSRNWVVKTPSVPPPGNLQFDGADVSVTTMLFQLEEVTVPNWFGVAIPNGLKDFTKANIFFHPSPGQAGYVDSDYNKLPLSSNQKAGKWPQLFYYLERLGYQLDGAARNQIIIMPFLTSSAADTGIFAPNWSDLVTEILTQVRSSMGADDGSTLQISNVAVSSFSVGIVYSHAFRQSASGLSGVMAEVWDFDGNFSTAQNLSQELRSTPHPGFQLIQYDQMESSDKLSYHVPVERWADLVVPPKSPSDVHGLIRDFMFLHAGSQSSVGETVSGGVATTGNLGTASLTATVGLTAVATGFITGVTGLGITAQTGATGTTTGGTTAHTGTTGGGTTAHTGTTGATTGGTAGGGTTAHTGTTGGGTTGQGGTTAEGTGTTGNPAAVPGAPGVSPSFPSPPGLPQVHPGTPLQPSVPLVQPGAPGLQPSPSSIPIVPGFPGFPSLPGVPNIAPFGGFPPPSLTTPGFPASPSQPGVPSVPSVVGPPGAQATTPVASPCAPIAPPPIVGVPLVPTANGACCCAAVIGMVSVVSTTATTAITAITAIASRRTR